MINISLLPRPKCGAHNFRHFFDCSMNSRIALAIITIALVCSKHVILGACDNFIAATEIKGKKFFSSKTGEYLPIKGINYYPRPNDGALVLGSVDYFTEEHSDIWERDIPNFVKLNVNAIRIYAVDPGQNHDAFMCALKSAGIYVIVGLAASCEFCAISGEAAPDCYPADLKSRGQFIISEFSRYDNVLAFSAGNEINLEVDSTEINAPCQKQFLRDMRAFINSCPNMRQIPVGVDLADLNREANALYYACRSDSSDVLENAEYFGINVYLHCDGNAGSASNLPGYQEILQNFQSYDLSIPVMFTEFGCVNPSFPTINGYEGQRDFLQVDAIFSSTYSAEFAGGFVFEYSTELVFAEHTSPYPFTTYGSGNYGVGYFSPETCSDIDINCTYVPFPQFDNLATKYAAVDTSFEPSIDSYSPNPTNAPVCPAAIPPLSSFVWPAASVVDMACPTPLTVYCPNIPVECITTTVPGTTTPTTTPGTTTDTPTTTPANGTPTTKKPASAPVASKPSSSQQPTASKPTSPSSTPIPSSVAPLPFSSIFLTSSALGLGSSQLYLVALWSATCALLLFIF